MSRLAMLATAMISVAIPAWARSMTPQQFVTKAATAGAAEVTLSEMAVERAADPAVKKFAETMIADHSKANAELKTLAAQQHVTVPDLKRRQKAAADKLRGHTGAAFDRAYAKQMVADHEKAVSEFRKAADDAQLPPSLRDFARQTLPTLEHHLAEAKALTREVGAVTSGSTVGSGSGTSGGSGTGAGSATHSGAGTGGAPGTGNTGSTGVEAPSGTGTGPGTGSGGS